MSSSRHAGRFWLPAALTIGLALRLANLAYLRRSPLFDRPVLDGQFCIDWAVQILSGTVPAAPFYQDPLYPYLLAGLFGIFGRGLWPVYALHLLLGLLVVALVHDTTRRLFGRRAAAIAALLAALYKPFLFYEGQVEKTTVAVAAVTLLLWTLVRGLRSRAPGWAALTGIALGAACLSRGNLLIFVPLLPATFLAFGSGHWRDNRGRALAALAGALFILAPVSVRNSRLGGGFLVTNAQLGQNLYAGNGPYNRDGQNGTPPWVRTSPEFEQADFAAAAEQALGRQLTPTEVSRHFVAESLRWVRDNPGEFLRLLGKKALLYVNAFEVPDNTDIDFYARSTPVLRLPLPGFSLVFALGVPWLLLRGCTRGPRAPLAAFTAVYALAVVSFFVLSRFRAPAVPALLPFAGGFAAFLIRPALRGALPPEPWRRSLVLCVVALALSLAPVDRIPAARSAAQSLANIGAQQYREGDVTGAEASFRAALAEDPTLVGALRSLGVLYVRRGATVQAAPLLEQAVAIDPSDAVSRYYLGLVFERREAWEAALLEFEAAASLAPGRTDIREARDRAQARFQRPPAGVAPP